MFEEPLGLPPLVGQLVLPKELLKIFSEREKFHDAWRTRSDANHLPCRAEIPLHTGLTRGNRPRRPRRGRESRIRKSVRRTRDRLLPAARSGRTVSLER